MGGGSDLVALFTAMHSAASFLKLYGLKVDSDLKPETGASYFAFQEFGDEERTRDDTGTRGAHAAAARRQATDRLLNADYYLVGLHTTRWLLSGATTNHKSTPFKSWVMIRKLAPIAYDVFSTLASAAAIAADVC